MQRKETVYWTAAQKYHHIRPLSAVMVTGAVICAAATDLTTWWQICEQPVLNQPNSVGPMLDNQNTSAPGCSKRAIVLSITPPHFTRQFAQGQLQLLPVWQKQRCLAALYLPIFLSCNDEALLMTATLAGDSLSRKCPFQQKVHSAGMLHGLRHLGNSHQPNDVAKNNK